MMTTVMMNEEDDGDHPHHHNYHRDILCVSSGALTTIIVASLESPMEPSATPWRDDDDDDDDEEDDDDDDDDDTLPMRLALATRGRRILHCSKCENCSNPVHSLFFCHMGCCWLLVSPTKSRAILFLARMSRLTLSPWLSCNISTARRRTRPCAAPRDEDVAGFRHILFEGIPKRLVFLFGFPTPPPPPAPKGSL